MQEAHLHLSHPDCQITAITHQIHLTLLVRLTRQTRHDRNRPAVERTGSICYCQHQVFRRSQAPGHQTTSENMTPRQMS